MYTIVEIVKQGNVVGWEFFYRDVLDCKFGCVHVF